MYSIMPQTPPRFSFGPSAEVHHRHRPAFSSPLSSSPIRGSSPSPPPPEQQMNGQEQQQKCNQPFTQWSSNTFNTRPQHTQSSPIFPSRTGLISPTTTDQNGGSCYGSNPKFRFASRSSRPNPLLRRREDAQEGRRRLFLQNVRQRQEDKRWEMRGGEDELLKLEWQRLSYERQKALEAEFAQFDADLAAREEEELRRMQQQQQLTFPPNPNDRDLDAMMADVIAQQEEAEMQALLEALEGGGGAPGQAQPQQQQFSDDDDYDDVFMDLIRQQEEQSRTMAYSQDVEMS
ncbi:hypothetical protein VTJ49DRAFT_7568 [Mycothermus thermophilus]|uniref:Uncharacterized protein n=1 Tax=Humicola insolens TaxID=85995 RepID=A0ABR3VHG6_HUMIN